MKRVKQIFTLFLAGLLTFSIAFLMGISGVFAEKTEDTTRIGENDYIYFDLAAGNVNIGKDTYSGFVYVNGVVKPINGTHNNDNKYYIYQSTDTNKMDTGYATDNSTDCRVPQYNRVQNGNQSWNDFVTNNDDVIAVIDAWEDVAKFANRESTDHYITFKSESNYIANVTIDNIWSNYHPASVNRTTGGIGANLKNNGINCENTKIHLKLKGDNRVGCVHYSAGKDRENQIIFENGEENSIQPGSITVADFPKNYAANHWNSVIGAADNPGGIGDISDGIVINSGVIFAGSTPKDNCTAIGGGGNNYGRVTINGGTVTAVVSSTGTAIGGGIGYGDKGGDTDIKITDGTIYAYNLGIKKGEGDNFEKFVPAAAIGGGGSKNAAGSLQANITIKGGKIYAQSMGGAAIGGGCSANSSGGPATINIEGGTIIAKSTEGMYGTEKITKGVSIGGGTGKTSGGSVTLNISEKESNNTILRTGSIGGGLATEEGKKVGYANVTITGGDIVGQVIMAGGASEACKFTMSGGKIHDTNVTSEYNIDDENIIDPQKRIPIKYVRDNGGAVFINDEEGVATITGGTIENCKAKNGGAIYMNGGTANIKGGQINSNTATENGGAIYMEGGTANIEGGQIKSNTATENGGGVYLPGGDFTMNNGSIEGNKAKNGGGIFLSKPPTLNGGSINSNKADENGGGIYISDCVVTLQPKEAMYITKNTAKNGAGIYIHDSKSSNIADSADGSIDIVSSETIKTDAVGLLVEDGYNGHLYFTENTATNSGGAVCVDKGSFYLYSDKITVTNNKATENGGGVAVLEGNFTMTKGSIGAEGKANTAKNGGGAYVSNGEIWLKGGNINYNEATNGGGAYVIGNYNMINGDVSLNTANQSGGGIYVDNGTVTMYGGNVDKNSAENDGGGIHVSATKQDALVDILSGSISSNKAKSGGGISVVGEKGQTIEVTVGVNCEHKDRNTDNGEFTVFEYPANVIDCGKAHGRHENHIDNNLEHSSCPQVKENVASDEGGGFFLDSSHSKITIYCMWAEGNIAANDEDSKCMKVNGGELTIGDEDFDTHKNPDKGNPVKGNTTIHGSIMVEGGKVNIYGEMEGPKFHNDVKVDVKEEGDYYIDHRITESEHNDYKVHYYENFKGDGDKYEVNETYNLAKLEGDGKLGQADIDIPGGSKEHDDKLLVLYAIWEREEYILKFDPNVEPGESYSGTMENQIVPMLDGKQTIKKNEFKRKGYEFKGWTLTPTPAADDKVYPDEYKIEKDFTDKDGATVTLYAKWEKCNHKGHLVYKADENIMTESCDLCGGHTATAIISAVDADYDDNYHLATLEYSDNWLGEGDHKPENITYEMAASDKWDNEDTIDDDWKNDSQHKPLHAGNYTAMITIDKETAKAEYKINRIKWETPKVPKMNFKVENGVSIIEITNPTGDNIMYKIVLFNTTSKQEETVTGYLDWQKSRDFANIPFGHYYYFYAKKIEDRDHFDSDPSKSEAYLADGNNIIYIKSETGIKVVPDIGGGAFKYTVSAADGYHLRKYTDNLENAVKDAEKIPGAQDAKLDITGITLTRTGPEDKIYTYTVQFDQSKVAFCQLTLEFSGAAKDASVSSKVIDGQIFKDFNNKKTTSISNDSAFTAQFTVNDYIPDEYKEQLLKFSSNLPKDTTIIMKEEGRYWYTKLTEEKQNINLNEFIAMGMDENKNFEVDETGDTPEKFTYQFIIDFLKQKKICILVI